MLRLDIKIGQPVSIGDSSKLTVTDIGHDYANLRLESEGGVHEFELQERHKVSLLPAVSIVVTALRPMSNEVQINFDAPRDIPILRENAIRKTPRRFTRQVLENMTLVELAHYADLEARSDLEKVLAEALNTLSALRAFKGIRL